MPSFQHRNVEVDEQPDTQLRDSQVVQELRVMDWSQALNAFDFENNLAAHHDVQPMLAEEVATVEDRQGALSLESKTLLT